MNRTSDVYVKCIFNINVLIASFIVVLLWFHIMRNPMTMVTLFKTISGKCYIMIQQPIFIKYLVFQKQLKRSINFRCMRLPLRLYYVHYNQCLPWFICYILGVKWVQNICEVILYVSIECRNILHWIYKGKLMVWYLGLITMHVCKICQKCRSNVLKSIRKSKIHIFI